MRLSIIVPVYREAEGIGQSLSLLKRALPNSLDYEVIIVDGNSDDGTPERVQQAGFICLQGPRGRAMQMNAGAAKATGDYLLFLHSDTVLPPSMELWWRAVQHTQTSWGFFAVRLSGEAGIFRLIERAISLRSRLTWMATGDQAQFVRRDLWQKTGGFPELALMEDIEMSKRLRRIAAPLVWPDPAVTSSRRWEEGGVLRTVALMWGLRLAYWLGVSPQTLSRYYRTRRGRRTGSVG